MKTDRLNNIKNMRMIGITIFCDWEKEIDWLIEQVEKPLHSVAPMDNSAEAYSSLLCRNNVLNAENAAMKQENMTLKLRAAEAVAAINRALGV